MSTRPGPSIYAGFLALGLLSSTVVLGCRGPADETGGGGGAGGGGGTGDVDDTGAGGDDTGGGAGWDPRYDPLVAELESDLGGNLATGVSVAIWHDGELVFVEAFGQARHDEDVPLTPTSLMQIGSTTKMQTSLGLLQQVEAGRVALDETLDLALPGLEMANNPGITEQIEVEHLITHQGAFYDWIPWDQGGDDELLDEYTYSVFAEYLWVMNTPGAFWNYSNPNFVLAGLITQDLDAEGRVWPDYMVEEVYEPLGMDRTFARKSEVAADGDYSLGTGYVDLDTGEIGAGNLSQITDPGWARPAGLTWSTPTQMVEFGRFLMDGDEAVLGDELRAAMTEAHVDIGLYPDGSGYGYGVMVHPGLQVSETEYLETPVWQHGGNTLFFSSIFYVLPEHDFVISILSNGFGDDFSASLLEAITLTVDDLPEPVTPPAFEIDPDGFDAHVGSYDDPFNVGEMIITREGDTLLVEMPTLEEEYGFTVTDELYAYATDILYVQLNGDWYDLRFIKESEEAELTEWVAHRAFVCTRVDDEDEVGETGGPPSSSLAPDALEERRARFRQSLLLSRPSERELPPALRKR